MSGGRKELRSKKSWKQVEKTIESNFHQLTSTMNIIKRNIERTDEVLTVIEEKRPYDGSMNELFYFTRLNRGLTLTLSGYEELKKLRF